MADNKIGNGTFTTQKVHEWLEEIARNCWLSLHFDTPSSSHYGTEFNLTPGGYSRQKVNFTSPDNRVIWNENNIRWKGLSSGSIRFVGGWNAAENGDLMWFEKVLSPVTVRDGGSWEIQSGKLALSFA